MKKNIFSSLLFVGLTIFLFGCTLLDSETSPPETAYYIINASPDAPALDVYANGELVAPNLSSGSDTGYFLRQSGAYQIRMTPTGSADFPVNEVLSFNPNKYYSVFAVDSLKKIQAVFTEDIFKTPGADSSLVRFFHLSPNAPRLNALFFNSTDTIGIAGRSFNDQNNSTTLAAFKYIKPGTYNLIIGEADSTLLPIAAFTNIVFEEKEVYTVYLKGLYNNVSNPLSLGLIKHVQ